MEAQKAILTDLELTNKAKEIANTENMKLSGDFNFSKNWLLTSKEEGISKRR